MKLFGTRCYRNVLNDLHVPTFCYRNVYGFPLDLNPLVRENTLILHNILLMGLLKQHFGVLELYTWLAPKTHLGIENQILWSDVRFGCVFRNCVLPEGLAKYVPGIIKSYHGWVLSAVQWFHAFPIANALQKTPHMHLNTSPTCFERPRCRKIGFGPGAGK